jgi:hypothetical protein
MPVESHLLVRRRSLSNFSSGFLAHFFFVQLFKRFFGSFFFCSSLRQSNPSAGWSGTMPSIAGFASITYYDVSGNLFGSFPASFAGAVSLTYLCVLYTFPPIFHVYGLIIIIFITSNMTANPVQGVIPPLTSLTQLQQIIFSNASAPLPSFSTLTKLEALFITQSPYGAWPDIASSAPLQIFFCDSCGISGPIFDYSLYPTLQYFSAQSNNLSGAIPPMHSNITGFSVANNQLEGSVTFGTNLAVVNLANNRFSGSLPSIAPSLLVGFSIRNNRFSGVIPGTWGSRIESVDISENEVWEANTRRASGISFFFHVAVHGLDSCLVGTASNYQIFFSGEE